MATSCGLLVNTKEAAPNRRYQYRHRQPIWHAVTTPFTPACYSLSVTPSLLLGSGFTFGAIDLAAKKVGSHPHPPSLYALPPPSHQLRLTDFWILASDSRYPCVGYCLVRLRQLLLISPANPLPRASLHYKLTSTPNSIGTLIWLGKFKETILVYILSLACEI